MRTSWYCAGNMVPWSHEALAATTRKRCARAPGLQGEGGGKESEWVRVRTGIVWSKRRIVEASFERVGTRRLCSKWQVRGRRKGRNLRDYGPRLLPTRVPFGLILVVLLGRCVVFTSLT